MSAFLPALFLVCVLAAGALQIAWVSPVAWDSDVTISRGLGVRDIGKLLLAKGVVTSPPLFALVVKMLGAERTLQAGAYRFRAHVPLPEVVRQLTQGGRPVASQVRVPEGATAREIAEVLHSAVGIPVADFLAAAKNPSPEVIREFSWLPEEVRAVGLEGYLFGDTYELLEDTRAEEALLPMLRAFAVKALPVLSRLPKGYPLNLHQTVTLASIVEREAATWQDRRLVADIFLRRLAAGMALQADSTVNYLTGKNVARASFADLQTPSAYNTYTVRGLPPGPISSPTVLTLWAVLQPIPNPYWYFLTDHDSAVYYSKTFAEHAMKKRMIYE